jgi:hypothetical protein
VTTLLLLVAAWNIAVLAVLSAPAPIDYRVRNRPVESNL